MSDCFEEDPSSFVRLVDGYAKVTSMHISWAVGMRENTLCGYVRLRCQPCGSGSNARLVLDTRGLYINKVELTGQEGNTQPVEYCLDESRAHSTLGTPLEVRLPDISSGGDAQWDVIVHYHTVPEATALQWLQKDQTASGRYPFLFTQCQAIHARSMVPCQDLCQAKVTYTARVVYPAALTALMSANRTDTVDSVEPPTFADGRPLVLPEEVSSMGWAAQCFVQDVPIPPYLVALVVGELSGKRIGPKTVVWAEPSVVDKAAWEFADTGTMIQIAEELCGPLRFAAFDLLVLPPSFPYGGMENPCLTFVTPTLLAGDRSQVAVIAHELSHCWSGNLVTNKSWEHFWINEGLTVFTETHIIERMFGKEAASIRKDEGWHHVHTDIVERIGSCHNFTCLCPKLEGGQDPDDAFSSVPYEKGAALFFLIESIVGEEAMRVTLKEYFAHFSFNTISSGELQAFFSERHAELSSAIPWADWFHRPGLPLYRPVVDPTPLIEAEELASAWMAAETLEAAPMSAGFVNWPSGKKCVFLNTLQRHCSSADKNAPLGASSGTAFSNEWFHRMSRSLELLKCNCEVRCAFLLLWLSSLGSRADSVARDEAKTLATQQGRMKYTRPLYRALFECNKEDTQSFFKEHKQLYHPICVKMLERDLQIKAA